MEEKERSFLIPLGAIAIALLVVSGAVWFLFFRSAGGGDVAGQVTLDGTPVAGALIVFIDNKTEAPVTAQSESDGNYRLIGHLDGRVPPGTYKVAVTKVTLKGGTIPQGEALEQARAKGLLVNSLPKIYDDRATTPLQFEVRSGSNTINLELKKQIGPR